jgi:hypothetical protein
MPENRAPGWDAKEIARVANEKYGGLGQMFEKHGWPERGAAMMPAQQRHVADTYGSIEAFVKKHQP